MEIQQDFKELLEFLNSNKVEYLIVGAYALAFHGHPRYTGDIDIYVRPSSENAKKVMKALTEFGFGNAGIEIEHLSNPEKVIQLGNPPVKIDILTSISGLSHEEAFEEPIPGKYGDISVNFISRSNLIINKKASGRAKDLADLQALGVK
jgi:hypothetical protein